MSWIGISGVAVLTAIVCGLVSGIVASLGVDWYHVSSFEGSSGFLVIFIILAGVIGGLLLGGVIAGVVASTANPGFGKALGYSLATVVVTAILTTGGLRAMADVPPTIKGEELMLLVEVRWPASQQTTPASDPIVRTLELGILSGNVQRLSRQGPLWMEDARREDGRWIVPGAVELFTNQGTRVIKVSPTIPGAFALLLPMNGTPGKRDLQWSRWLPTAHGTAGPTDFGLTYRFKVIRRSQPSRTETMGPFQIDTIAQSFFAEASDAPPPMMAATGEFAIRYHGQLLAFDAGIESGAHSNADNSSQNQAPAAETITLVQAVATLPGLPAALLIRVYAPDQGWTCRLVTDGGSAAIITVIAHCEDQLTATPLTTDPEWRQAAKRLPLIVGRIDRVTFMHPGVYVFTDAIFDADKRVVRPLDGNAFSTGFSARPSIPPLGSSPDGRSIVRIGEAWEPSGTAVLQDFDTETNTSHLLIIDKVATRFASSDAVDLEWFNHYYEWHRAADGNDRLTARANVDPLPYRGVLHTESSGNLTYLLQPSGAALCAKLVEFLRSDFAAENIVKSEYADSYVLHIEGVEVNLFVNTSDHQVTLFLGSGGDNALVRRIATAFDAVLATGKYNELFESLR